MKKKLEMKKYFVEEKTQMKKTNVENFKEVTHEIEFMLFSDLVSLTVITCGKLIGYEKARDLLHKYISSRLIGGQRYIFGGVLLRFLCRLCLHTRMCTLVTISWTEVSHVAICERVRGGSRKKI